MSSRKIVVAIAFVIAGAAAVAGFAATLPEPATVTLVFIALSAIGLAGHRKPVVAEPVEG